MTAWPPVALDLEACNRVRNACPCDAPLILEHHEFREGIMDGRGWAPKLIRIVINALYFHDATGRGFCSALCSLRWHEQFWRPYRRHIGQAA